MSVEDGAGAVDELDRFLSAVQDKALRMAQLSTRDVDEALDLVQDAMMRFSARYASRPSAEWHPLFYRILDNRIKDWHRRRQARFRWLGHRWSGSGHGEGADSLPAHSAVPERDVGLRDARSALIQALESLPLRQRQVFLLRCWEGMDVAQTAGALGISPGSVKTHLSRAMAALRAALQDHWPP